MLIGGLESAAIKSAGKQKRRGGEQNTNSNSETFLLKYILGLGYGLG